MRLPIVIFAAATLALGSLSGTASAQAKSALGNKGGAGGFTGGSMFSSGGTTGGLGGGTGGLGGAGGGLGGSGGGLGGAGGGLGGQNGQGGLGGGGGNALGQQQNAGFIGRNGSNNQFIGAAAQGLNGQNGQNANQNRQNNRGARAQNLPQLTQQTGGQDANRNAGVRPRQKVAFDHPTLQMPTVVASIEARFKKLSTRHPSLNSVTLAADEGDVVLTGQAASRADARMAESIVRLEPGVRGVRNEMTYPAPTDEVQ